MCTFFETFENVITQFRECTFILGLKQIDKFKHTLSTSIIWFNKKLPFVFIYIAFKNKMKLILYSIASTTEAVLFWNPYRPVSSEYLLLK